jgi:hypothetical protein
LHLLRQLRLVVLVFHFHFRKILSLPLHRLHLVALLDQQGQLHQLRLSLLADQSDLMDHLLLKR